MTLIATLPVNGVPVLIGDLMLSRSGADDDHCPLPTINPAQILGPNQEWKVAGAHRKICIVNPRLAVGWTGRLDIAAHLISALLESFSDRPADLYPDLLWQKLDNSWASAVESSPELDNDDITILGWLIDKEEFINAFEWSKGKKTLHGDSELVARGSGAVDFEELVKSSESQTQADGCSLNVIAMESVSLVASLLGRELGTGANLWSYYGGGYDIVLLTKDGFCFLDSILYVPVVVEDIEAECCKLAQPTYFLRFSYVNGNLLILRRIIQLAEDGTGISQNTEVSIIGKFGTTKHDLEALDVQPDMPLRSSIVSLIFMAKTECKGIIYAPFVGAGNSESFSFKEDRLCINTKVTKKMIPLMHELAIGS